MYTSSRPQTNEFAIARRSLKNSIHQLANVNFDLAEFRGYLIPFNKHPPTSPSPSSSTASKEYSYAEDSPGSLLKYTVDCNRTNIVEEIRIPLIRLLYTATTSGPPHPEQFSVFSIPIDLPMLSEQTPSSRLYAYPETSHQIQALPSTNLPNVEAIEGTLDGCGKNSGSCNAGWVNTASHSTSGWGNNN